MERCTGFGAHPRRDASLRWHDGLAPGPRMNAPGLIRLLLLLVIVIGLIWYLLYGMSA
jgi:hypothetical protein